MSEIMGVPTVDVVVPNPRRWWALVALSVALFLVVVDNTVLQVALPTIQRHLRADQLQLTWIVNSFIVAFAGSLLVGGALGDRFGRRLALLVGLVLVGGCALAGSRAGTPDQLITARAGMGVGAALVMPGTLSLLSALFVGAERARAIAIWASISALGVVVGPVGGGALVEHFGWGSVFVANTALAAVAFVAVVLLVPEARQGDHVALDIVGAVTAMVALVALFHSLTAAPSSGWGSTEVAVGFGVAGLFAVAFFAREVTTRHPLLPLRLFRDPRLAGATLSIMAAFFGLVGSSYFLTQYLQFVLGYSPLAAGVRLLPVAIGLAVGAPSSPKLADRLGAGPVVAVGLCILGVAMLVMRTTSAAGGYPHIALAMVLGGLGVGLSTPTATNSVMSVVPARQFGVGAGINDTTREFGGAVGVAVLNSVLAASFRGALLASALRTIPNNLHNAAKDSLGSALALAGSSSDPKDFAHAAKVAYVSAMHTGLLVAALATFAGALASGLVLGRRHVPLSVLAGGPLTD